MPTVYDEDQQTKDQAEQTEQSLYDREFKSIADNYDKTAEDAPDSAKDYEKDSKKTESSREGGDGFYKANIGGKKISFSKKKGIGIGGIAVGGIAGLLFFFISLGPLQFLQFSNLIQKVNFSDQDLSTQARLRNMVIYAKAYSRGDTSELQNTRLGTIEAKRANKIDQKLEANGLTSKFSGGKFDGFDIDYSKLPQSVRDELKGTSNSDTEKRASVLAKHYGIDVSDLDVKPDGTAKIPAQNAKNNRRILASVMRTNPDIGRITTAMTKRVLIKRANIGWNPVTRYTEEKRRDFWKNLSERFTGNSLEVEARQNTTNDESNPANQEEIDKINQANNESNDLTDAAKKGDGVKLGKLVGGGAALAVVSALCTVKEVAGQAEETNAENKISAGLKSANLVLALGSKTQNGGDIDLATLGEYSKLLNNKENSDWNSADIVKYESSGESPDSEKKRVLKDYPELDPESGSKARQVDELFNEIEGIPGLGWTFGAACGIFSAIDAVTSKIVAAIDRTGLLKKLEDKISSVMMSVLAGVAPDMTQEKYRGLVFGEVAALGGRYMANETSATMGGRALSNAEEIALNEETRQYLAEIDTRNSFQKFADLSDPQNPLGQMAVNLRSQNITSTLAKLPNLLTSSFSSILNNRVSAADEMNRQDLYYGVPKLGFTPAEFDGEKYADPYENAIWVQNNVTPDVVKEFEECNNVIVSDDWNFTTKSFDEGALIDYKKIEDKKCTNKSEAYTRLRILALDTSILKSFSCYEFNDEESCQEITGTSNSEGVSTGLNCVTKGVTAPPEDYSRTSYDGVTVNKRTAVMIKQAEEIYGKKFNISQGSYNAGGVSASAGTHDGGGAIDISASSLSEQDREKAVKALRQVGFAAWLRTPAQADWGYHIHAIAIGDKELAPGAQSQVDDYFNGYNGLSGNGKDSHPDIGRPIPEWATKFGDPLCPN